jgi:flagellar biosynthetic protein FliR
MLVNSPIISFLTEPQDLIFLFYIFARISGLFMISPLFSQICVTRSVRLVLTVFITLILSMILYPQYRGSTPAFFLNDLSETALPSLLLFCMTMVKEVALGYLMGFVFALLYEALIFAGQAISSMMGVSMNSVIYPVTEISSNMIAKLFTLSASLLLLSMDLHHDIIRAIAESFTVIPVGQYQINHQTIQHLTQGSSALFQYGIQFGAIPLAILTLAAVGLGFLARAVPEMNIFMLAYPLKILIGTYALMMTLHGFPYLLRSVFLEYESLVKLLLHQ